MRIKYSPVSSLINRFILIPIYLFLFSGAAFSLENNYLIGVGKYDVTGSAAEIGMMGYAVIDQKSAGIHNRQYARAYIMADESNGNRMVFVNVDAGALFQSVQQGVIKKLSTLYGNTYTEDNVILSATHTHAAIGGQSHYALYDFTILGYIEENYDAHVNGITAAITEAHNDLKPGHVLFNSGSLTNASINRSMEAYNNNPQMERDNYAHAIDDEMQVLRIVQQGVDVGMVSWFGVHPTSMKNTNQLLSSDNKGRAQYRFEKNKGADFIAGFAQSNHADTSPNIQGNGVGPSPTDDMFENTEIIGDRQYEKALELYNSATEQLTGNIEFRHQFNDYSNMVVRAEFTDGNAQQTCEAALGYAFGAGTEDGLGSDAFNEGQRETNPLWNIATYTLTPPTQADIDCQAPKPILLKQSGFDPYPWTPEVLPTSIVKVGQLVLLAVPGEFTTMAGRRLRNTVESVLGTGNHYVVAGLSNAYAGYMTTKEEYDMQHYEGGSTHFGPWTLAAFEQTFHDLALSLTMGSVPSDTATPRDLSNTSLVNFATGVVHDQAPIFKSIGQVVSNTNSSYTKGQTAKVVFWTGHPRNNLRTEDTFLKIQKKNGSSWETVATDNDWETKYKWKRIDGFWGTSQATIEWAIPSDAASGTYRIKHYGNKKYAGKISSFTGKSREFSVN
jgi:neutral ceramidase